VSVKDKLQNSYFPDPTSHDLFDVFYQKERAADKPDSVVAEFEALAGGYKRIGELINTKRTPGQILTELTQIPKTAGVLDPRIVAPLAEYREPAHGYARLVLWELVCTPGLLLTEQYVAARLGVDVKESAGWGRLLQELLAAQYTGIFSEAWRRWWWGALAEWWGRISRNASLASMDANTRVGLLRAATGIQDLVAARPILPGRSSRFWVECAVTSRPLDPSEGFRIAEREPLPWQEPRYISQAAILSNEVSVAGLQVHPMEEERVERLLGSAGTPSRDSK
jgi:hypothetical protein